MIAKMRGVKRKLTTYAEEERRLNRQVEARIAHLGELYGMHTVDDVAYESWSRARLDRLLIDYLLRQGYNESAADLARERGKEDLVDIETFVQMSKIQESLRTGSVAEALAWCQDNKKELRKMDVSSILIPDQCLVLVSYTTRPDAHKLPVLMSIPTISQMLHVQFMIRF
jgi:macrophage erythroblast attacher